MRHARTLFFLLPIAFGCGGSIQIVLKSPVESQCSSAGLQGCPELTEGVLLYVEGHEDKGQERIAVGAAQNAPDKLRKFAKALKELKKIPGAAGYAKPLFKVADILAASKGKAGAGAGAGPDDPGPPGAPPPGGARLATADDLSRYGNLSTGPRETGVVAPATSPARGPCGPIPGYTCAPAVPGPLVVTDLQVSPDCPAEMVVGIDSGRWIVRNPRGLNGERGLVRTGETMIVGVAGAAASNPRCSVSWAGIRPPEHR